MRWRGLVAAGLVVVLGAGVVGCSGGDDDDDAGATTTTEAAGESTITTAAEPEGVTAAELCADAQRGEAPATVAEADLTEVSGVAASRRNDGVLWMHDDSGGDPEVFAVGLDGAPRGSYLLEGAEATDWEDMASGPDDLYLGDIGDNTSQRDGVTVYRVAEPTLTGAGDAGEQAMGGVEALTLTYADGARDAETLLADPVSGDLFVVSKQWDGAPAGVYRIPADTPAGATVAMERVGDAAVPDGELATGGDVSADGSLVAIRTYQSVLLWDRAPDQTVAEALAGEPCKGAATAELQGESVAFLPSGEAYVTVSEGESPPINVFALP